MVNKGTVSTIGEAQKTVTVKPYTGDIVTVPLVVPFFLYGSLEVGMPVVYATFEDNTGIVLARMDGEWNNSLVDVETFGRHTHAYAEGITDTPIT